MKDFLNSDKTFLWVAIGVVLVNSALMNLSQEEEIKGLKKQLKDHKQQLLDHAQKIEYIKQRQFTIFEKVIKNTSSQNILKEDK